MSERLNQGIAGSGKLVFFRHQGRKWRNIPMVNVTCLKTTIWNFIEIREICDGSAAPELHITQPKFDQKKHGQFNFQYSHISLLFLPLSFFRPSLCGYHVRCLYGRGKHEPRFVKVDFDQPLPSQPVAARLCLTVFTVGHITYIRPRASISQWVSLSQCQSVSSLYLYFSYSNIVLLNIYFVESKLSESPSYCHFEKLYV